MEVKFAEGLEKLGYLDLAQEQLIRTQTREYLPPRVREEATKRLARLYRTIGKAARDEGKYNEALGYYNKAVASYDDYLARMKDIVSDEEYNKLLYESGQMCAAIGRDEVAGMENTADEKERVSYKKSATLWFTSAEEKLDEAAALYVKLRDDLADIPSKTLDLKKKYQEINELAGKIVLEQAKARYDSSRVYSDEAERATRDAKLQEAIRSFQEIVEAYKIYDVRYTAERYTGLCYRDLGQYDQATAHLKEALKVQRIPSTVWIIRLARYNLAQTYNDMGDPDKAMTSADAALGELQERQEFLGQTERDMLFAVQIEKGRALVGAAKQKIKRAEGYEKDPSKVKFAPELRMEARRDYQYAVDVVYDIAGDPKSKWARNAQNEVKVWLDESENILGAPPIKVRQTFSYWLTQGRSLFEQRKFLESIQAYQKAAEMGNPVIYGRTLLPEAWYQMGAAYYHLSSPEHTGGKYTYYYESALCFSQVATTYPKADLAPHAARVAYRLCGALFNQGRAMEGPGRRDALMYDGDRYFAALKTYTEMFPAKSEEVLFDAAELARTIERYEQASDLYSRVRPEHDAYYAAKYMRGLCLYLEALRLYDRVEPRPTQTIGSLLDRAAKLYQGYIEWYVNNKDRLGPERLEVASKAVANTKISFGKLLVHPAWTDTHEKQEGARTALAVLENFEDEHLTGPGREELHKELLPQAFFVNIRAYLRLDELANAEEFVEGIVKRFQKHPYSAAAASMLGYAYLNRRRELEEQEGTDLEATEAAARAARYLEMALDLDPEQSLGFYVDVAGELYRMEEYEQAVRILDRGLERFPVPETGVEPGTAAFRAVAALEGAHLKLERWSSVEKYATQLLAAQAGRNIDYTMDLALALEEQRKYDGAIDHWNKARGFARNARVETAEARDKLRRDSFFATVHLARCYAFKGTAEDADHGFKVIGWVMLSRSDWFQDPEWAAAVEELLDEAFQDRWPTVYDYVLGLLQADPNLLRQPKVVGIVRGFQQRHWPDKKDELDKLIKEAGVERATGT